MSASRTGVYIYSVGTIVITATSISVNRTGVIHTLGTVVITASSMYVNRTGVIHSVGTMVITTSSMPGKRTGIAYIMSVRWCSQPRQCLPTERDSYNVDTMAITPSSINRTKATNSAGTMVMTTSRVVNTLINMSASRMGVVHSVGTMLTTPASLSTNRMGVTHIVGTMLITSSSLSANT